MSGEPLEISHVKSGCGVFGVLRKRGAPPISPEVALAGIECVRYRGSRFGAGFGLVRTGPQSRRIKAFAASDEVAEELRRELQQRIGKVELIGSEYASDGKIYASYVFEPVDEQDHRSLRRSIGAVNRAFSRPTIRARIYSWGRYVEVFKGIGYPSDVYELYSLSDKVEAADLWISHTRQPTNSPGRLPIWSHPFASGEWAIVHNGDVSSFGANMEFLSSLGADSFVGTDSEVIALLLDYLTSEIGLKLEEACRALVNPFEGSEDTLTGQQLSALRGAQLDGPFSVVAGFSDGNEAFMVVLVDRFKFRPIVVGEDENYFYAASEEAQIRRVSPNARVWTIEPGGYMIASTDRGLIRPGRRARELFMRFSSSVRHPTPTGVVIDALGLNHSRINSLLRDLAVRGCEEVSLINVSGQRYIGVGVDRPLKVKIHGTPGNCLANFNDCVDFEVFGSVQDDVGDVMHGGSVVVHGDARDVLGQALQGGYVFVKGNAGNRCGIQMREYSHKRPYMVIGGTVDDYLGEYMAGGVIVVLGLGYEDSDLPLVGKYVGSGMVGGRILVRGEVPRDRIGYLPPREDVVQYLRGLKLDGELDDRTFRELISAQHLDYEILRERLAPDLLKRVGKLFEHKYFRRLRIEPVRLDAERFEDVCSVLREFGKRFSLEREVERALDGRFTLIEPLRGPTVDAVRRELPKEEG
ncbi:MAG: glutamate synthase [Thaumarchaeota archaeon]|nr:glutamate synthase [Candidatus Calditenuaceae archaeon]MDW8042579.1 glutamate synthase [Nitrososphaerota archaeon]